MTKLDPGDAVSGSISLISILIGLPLNLIMLTYFVTYTGKRTLSYMLYFCICVVDITIISCHFPTTLSYLSDRSPLLFGSDLFCSIWGLIWNTAMRVSVFIISVLCVSRMMAVVFPLRKIHRHLPLYLVAGYILLMFVQSSVPFWSGSLYKYDEAGVTCYDNASHGFALYFIMGVFEFLAPLLVVVPTCGISIWALYKSKKREADISQGQRSNLWASRRCHLKNNATLTMILLTLAYVLFNAPLVLYTTFSFFQLTTKTTLFDGYLDAFHGHEVMEKGRFHLLNFSFSISVCLNSTTNAIVYTSRSIVIKSWFRLITGKKVDRKNESMASTKYIQLSPM